MKSSSRARAMALLAAIVGYTAFGLAADRYVGGTGQLGLGALTWSVLLVVGFFVAPAARLQVAAVVAIASIGEVLASLVWGLYVYRLDNVPAFVPPGHGLVFVGGLALVAATSGYERQLRRAALATLVTWGVLGVTVLPRADSGGAALCVLLACILLRTRRPLYSAMFVVVAALELYGTAVGAWTWAATIPGTSISNGNPPSGVASGYVLLDVLAATAAARVMQLRLVELLRSRLALRRGMPRAQNA